MTKTHRDLGLSYIIAPLRNFIPILGYLILYPTIISRYGLEVLGVWSLLGVIPQALSTMDVGFSLILTREAGGRHERELPKVLRKYCTARKAILLAALLLFGLASLFVSFGELPKVDYRPTAVTWAVVLMMTAVVVQRLAALDSAILNGRGDNYFVHLTGAWSPAIFFGIAIFGVVYGFPLESLSFGYLVTNLISWLVYRKKLRISHSVWWQLTLDVQAPIRLNEIVRLAKDGAYLYAASVGMVIRDPILKYTIGLLVGLDSVAIYEIAMRVGGTGRNIISAGFTALFPSFAVLMRNSSSGELEIVTRQSLFLLIIAGWSALGGVYIFTPWIFEVWLGSVDSTIVSATRIVCIWAAITLCNTPFWYQLMAGKGEKQAANAIWVHTGSIIALVPFVWLFGFQLELNSILLYWLFGAIATQLAIYVFAERQFGLVIAVFSKPQIFCVMLLLSVTVVTLTSLSGHGSLSPVSAAFLHLSIVGLILLINRRHITYWITRKEVAN